MRLSQAAVNSMAVIEEGATAMSKEPFRRIVSKFVYFAANEVVLIWATFVPMTRVSVPAPPSMKPVVRTAPVVNTSLPAPPVILAVTKVPAANVKLPAV